MNRVRLFRLAIPLVPAAALALIGSAGFAETPPAAPASPPAATAVTPTPAAPPAVAAPAATPAPSAQTPPPAEPKKVQTADPFGEDVTLSAKMVVALKGTGEWDSAFETLTDSLRTLTAFLDKQGIKPAGLPMIVYTSTDDNGFGFIAEIPIDQEPKGLPKTITVSKSPDGKVLKFVHRGSYDNMDNTYEAITNHLDDRKLEAKDTFIEEYVTDPLKTPDDKLIINVFVPLK
jgi:effector-binding domain-containing protein